MNISADWAILSDEEISLIHDLDEMDSDMTSFEVEFLSSLLEKLQRYGEYKAQFTVKQRNLLRKLADKYLE